MTVRALHPNAVAGCKACEKSVSGLCIQHAGGQVPKADDPRRCAGFNKNGQPCRKWRLADGKFCLAHQEDALAAKESVTAPGRVRQVEKAARDHLKALGRPTDVDLDALEALADLADEAIALKAWLLDEMKKRVLAGDNSHEIDQSLNRYVTALDRAAKLVEGYGKHGLEKRLVEVREELASLVTAVFNSLLVFVPLDSQPAAIVELQRTVAAIEQPKALTA